MIVDHLGKIVWLEANDVGRKSPCPECGVPYRSNSTGPANRPWLTKLLHLLPSEDVLGGIPPLLHDYACLLCPAGWTVAMQYDGKVYEAHSRATADRMYLRLMLARVKIVCRLEDTRRLYRALAYRNYQAVHLAGDSSYCHKH